MGNFGLDRGAWAGRFALANDRPYAMTRGSGSAGDDGPTGGRAEVHARTKVGLSDCPPRISRVARCLFGACFGLTHFGVGMTPVHETQ